MKEAIIYARAASGTREALDLELSRQIAECRAFAASTGYHVSRAFHDHGSGNDPGRSGLNALLAYIAKCPHEVTVIVEGPERMARDISLLRTLHTRITQAGGRLEWIASDGAPNNVDMIQGTLVEMR